MLRLGTALEEGLGAAACSPLGGEVGGFVRELDQALVGGLVGPLVGAEVGDYSDDSTVGCSEDWSAQFSATSSVQPWAMSSDCCSEKC